MRNSPDYSFEKALFIAAADGLSIAQSHGISASGHEAFLAAKAARRNSDSIYLLKPHEQSLEIQDYYRRIGRYVELAAELAPAVDPKR